MAEQTYALAKSGVYGQANGAYADALSAIPDSVVYQYLMNEGSGQTLADSIGNEEISTNFENWVSDSEYEGGYKIVSDGVDDSGDDGTMGNFGSTMDTNFAIGLQCEFDHTNAEAILGVLNDGENTLLNIVPNFGTSGALAIDIRSDNGNLQRIETGQINDGDRKTVLFNKTGQSASDMEVYVNDPDTDVSSVNINDGDHGTFSDFEYNMTYFARDNRGSVDSYFDGGLGLVEWFDDSLSSQERSDWFAART